jgi:hypothetical protein
MAAEDLSIRVSKTIEQIDTDRPKAGNVFDNSLFSIFSFNGDEVV